MPDKSCYNFVAKQMMPSGMTAQITFYGDYWDDQRTAEFSVWLVVYKKRKDISKLFLKQTGKDGLKTLLFAKEAIREFEKYILREFGNCHQKIFINIEWDDNRRRDIYYRGLKNDGFEFRYFRGRKILSKEIKNRKVVRTWEFVHGSLKKEISD